MKLTLLRNATLVLELAGKRILVDPMLSAARGLWPMAALRFRPRFNPLVELPAHAGDALAQLDACLLTHFRHGHVDHLDRPGRKLLAERELPTYCQAGDAPTLQSAGIRAIDVGREPQAFFGGTLHTVPAQHGRGIIGRLMGRGAGFVIRMPNEPCVYLSGDTVLTPAVIAALESERPNVTVVHAGGAQLDIGGPILMTLAEVLRFVQLAPGEVVAVHLEALNHCPTTRAEVRSLTNEPGVGPRLHVPDDGETLSFEKSWQARN
ncbi:MAG: MBL fold metallo-hydrolase [Pirellulales bacterium]|nr:MBL fold metallo-hydrolase [Pirellulales bacterium]